MTLDACRLSTAPVIASHTGVESLYNHIRCIFRKGHRLRFIVTSSSNFIAFPKTITRINPYDDPKPETVQQIIYHLEEYPSHVKTYTDSTYEATFDSFNGSKEIPVNVRKGQTLIFKINWDARRGSSMGQHICLLQQQ